MKKLTSHKQLNKIAKGTLAVALAGTFTFSASKAFADQTTNQQDHYQTVDLQSQTNAEASTPVQTTQTQETPSMLPGDFFYFAKKAFEKIQLALTFDNVKEAKLLANFASERLAEAQALFASGDQETAIKTINQALEDMKGSDTIVDSQKQSELSLDQEKVDTKETDHQAMNTDETKTEDVQSSANQVKSDDQTNREAATDENKDDQEVTEVKTTQAQNIVALTAAMEKVKNPVAKAALQRNIKKSYAKLAKKLDKVNSRLAKKETKKADSETEGTSVNTDENTNVAADSSVTATSNVGNTNASGDKNGSVYQTTTLPTKELEQPGKQAHQEMIQVKQAAKQEVKQTQQAAKQQIQQKREEVKSMVAEKKAEVKQKVDESKGNK
ncbi:DUF5667 domain-containing protein [Bacillus sp. EB600]|uniref:DUF5667 domain-containing protein n=1 Tax=Bacillus sp. EB600 TaxID=2806345 RepID=UPI00210A4BFC|nr:DUF5667 domain-containing protein [Bacillus sp. EB600]MCQ6279869.1 hypothetical protein [Bacillus sp. EB600]